MASTGTHKRKPGKRGKVSGWSPGAARRNTAFLRSVDETTLDGIGLALTLTVRDCPDTTAEWTKAVDTWIKRQRRGGMVRLHWVMEFQRRGTPHLHVAIWYQGGVSPGTPASGLVPRGSQGNALRTPTNNQVLLGMQGISNTDMQKAEAYYQQAAMVAIADWIELTQHLGTGSKGQHARPIADAVGWFMYLAKHCGRGRHHYQRQQENLPAAWPTPPRVWGKSGTWSTIEPATVQLTDRQFYRLRRLVRSWRVSKARAALPGEGWSWEARTPLLTRSQLREAPLGGRKPLRHLLGNLKHARGMLRCDEAKLSAVRGVSEWISEDEHLRLLQGVM